MSVSPASHRRILLIGADGLRPDLLDPAIMPHVAALAARGTRFTDHHAAYPSHTRVNMSTLATGCSPGRHGVVANTMLVPGAREDHIIDTGNYQHLDALDAHTGGKALFVPALGDLLAPHGARVAVAGTGTSGSNLLWTRNHRHRLVNTNSAYGLADLYDLREKLGDIPPAATPHIERVRYATRAVTDIYLPDPDNRVIVLWLAEPDSSLHACGIGSPEMIEALAAVDAAVGEIMGRLDRLGSRDQFDIFFLSDHGHSTVRAHNTLREHLAAAARDLGNALPPLATASDYIYPQPGDAAPPLDHLAPLVEWLYAQPWCDLVLSPLDGWNRLPGVLPLADLWNGHTNARQPLLAVSPTWSDEPNEFGRPGTIASLTTQSAMKSSHGSVSPYDMHATLIASGPSFREGMVSGLPTGATDLAPTILTLLGIDVPAAMDGRVLREALPAMTAAPERLPDQILEPAIPAPGRKTPRVRLHRVDRTVYVHGSMPTGS